MDIPIEMNEVDSNLEEFMFDRFKFRLMKQIASVTNRFNGLSRCEPSYTVVITLFAKTNLWDIYFDYLCWLGAIPVDLIHDDQEITIVTAVLDITKYIKSPRYATRCRVLRQIKNRRLIRDRA